MIRIIVLTDAGHDLARRLKNYHSLGDSFGSDHDDVSIWYKPKPFADRVQTAFTAGDKLIFICATGIVIRTLAPVLADKREDPPVLVLDELGRFVVPLLSGHEGGANHWAKQVADRIDAQLVLTTANAYIEPIYTVGMGCERGCSEDDLQSLLAQCLREADLDISQIARISSIDIKADEEGLIQLAKTLGVHFETWDKTKLSEVDAQLSIRSDYVFNTVGVYGVAESAALVSAKTLTGNDSELVLNKHKTSKATCAIARSFRESDIRTMEQDN